MCRRPRVLCVLCSACFTIYAKIQSLYVCTWYEIPCTLWSILKAAAPPNNVGSSLIHQSKIGFENGYYYCWREQGVIVYDVNVLHSVGCMVTSKQFPHTAHDTWQHSPGLRLLREPPSSDIPFCSVLALQQGRRVVLMHSVNSPLLRQQTTLPISCYWWYQSCT